MRFRDVVSVRVAAILAAVTLFITAIVPAAQAAIGRVPGGASVSQGGMASYVIPIRATPGVRGLAPALAIAYTGSPDVRGMLGVGFTLAGLSSIAPCPQTVAQDGQYAPVLLGTGDRYCRDGQRLIADVAGTDGANLATYRTEIDQIARVTSYTAVGATQPDWFKVETVDGLIWQYGAANAQGTLENSEALTSTTSTGKTFEWLVKTITDRAGNVLTFTYDNDPSQKRLRPLKIQYTGRTPSGGGDYSVDFVYEPVDLSEPVIQYKAAGLEPASIEDRRLLLRMELKYQNTIYKQYSLDYNTGAGGNKRLQSVNECAATTSDCLPATTFAWPTPQPGFAAAIGTTAAAPTATGFPIDVNGDGREDLVYPNGSTWWLMLGTASGFGLPTNTSITATNPASALPIEWNGDGRMDLLVDSSDGKWRVMQGTTTGLAAPVPAKSGAGLLSALTTTAWTSRSSSCRRCWAAGRQLPHAIPAMHWAA